MFNLQAMPWPPIVMTLVLLDPRDQCLNTAQKWCSCYVTWLRECQLLFSVLTAYIFILTITRICLHCFYATTKHSEASLLCLR